MSRVYSFGAACEYCGNPADTVDHVPARSVRKKMISIGLPMTFMNLELDCCRQCNSVLGSLPLNTFAERRAFIKVYLKRKYAKYLKIPSWTEDEIAEKGDILQVHIKAGQEIAINVRKRIAWNRKLGG